MEKILLYCNQIEKKKKIDIVAKLLKINIQEITPKDLLRTVGAIAGVSKEEKKEGAVPVFYQMPETMIFVGFDEQKLDSFLSAYRMAKIDPIEMKAIMTMYNCSWTLFQLLEELKKENQMMKK